MAWWKRGLAQTQGAVQKGDQVNSNSSSPGEALGSRDVPESRMAGAAQGWQSRAAPVADEEAGLA